MVVGYLKLCGGKHGCGRVLPLCEFYTHRATRDGCQKYCKECYRKVVRSSYARNVVRHQARKYGMDEELAKQLRLVPVCQSCGANFDALNRANQCRSDSSNIDHCHEEGHVRGMLCKTCNFLTQGPSAEAMKRLRGCIAYLERDLERQALCHA